jgi:bifunctional DNA-binding transcriptional regulator/antitoxin component of YhaV-PrlF toxin-antitoxin module
MVEIGTYESTVIADKSFRTVIPKPVAKALGLQHKVKIYWELKVEDGKILAIVKKI